MFTEEGSLTLLSLPSPLCRRWPETRRTTTRTRPNRSRGKSASINAATRSTTRPSSARSQLQSRWSSRRSAVGLRKWTVDNQTEVECLDGEETRPCSGTFLSPFVFLIESFCFRIYSLFLVKVKRDWNEIFNNLNPLKLIQQVCFFFPLWDKSISVSSIILINHRRTRTSE